MIIPWWKKLFSYFTEITLEETSSPYNPLLTVSMKAGRFMLSTDKAIYSYGDRYDNFAVLFKKMDFSNINDILILGFGLGSIPHIIEKTLGHKCSYTGVEIDEEVIYLASKYELSSLDSEVELLQADASTFIAQNTRKYDLICMDIFENDYIPERFESPDFLLELKEILTPDGMIIYNRLAYTKTDLEHSVYFYEKIYHNVFPESVDLRVKGNLMLCSRPLS